MGLGREKGGEGKKNKERFTEHLLWPGHWLMRMEGRRRHKHGAFSSRL